MPRSTTRRGLTFEGLESRQVLSGAPTATQQYMLEMINEARTNPSAAVERIERTIDATTRATINFYDEDLGANLNAIRSERAVAPVAWNDALARASVDHSNDQIRTGRQSHDGSDGSSLDTRLERAGYRNRRMASENVYAYADNENQAQQAFLVDWGVASKGHRRNIMDSSAQEVGVGIVDSPRTNSLSRLGPKVVTQNFGRRADFQAQVLGVVYDDRDGNNAYSLGEGRGDVQIDVTNMQNGQTRTARTWDAGGYQLPFDGPGRYRVTARLGNMSRSKDINTGSDNVKVDFRVNELVADQSGPTTPTPAPTRRVEPANIVNNRSFSAPTKVEAAPIVTVGTTASTPAAPTVTPVEAPAPEDLRVAATWGTTVQNLNSNFRSDSLRLTTVQAWRANRS